MRTAGILLLFAFTLSDSKQYTLTIKITGTEQRSDVTHSQKSETDCTTDDFGHTNCTTTGGGSTRIIHFVQTAEGSDGKTYELECLAGAWRSAAQGAAMGAGAAVVHQGCESFTNGEYQARFDRSGLKLAYKDKVGKPREQGFTVLSSNEQKTATSYGSVHITCEEANAEIFVDDTFVGNTPSTLKLSAGKHQIRAIKKEKKVWEREVTVLADSQVSLRVTLEP